MIGMRAFDFWIKTVFGDFFFAALLALALVVAVLSNFW